VRISSMRALFDRTEGSISLDPWYHRSENVPFSSVRGKHHTHARTVHQAWWSAEAESTRCLGVIAPVDFRYMYRYVTAQQACPRSDVACCGQAAIH